MIILWNRNFLHLRITMLREVKQHTQSMKDRKKVVVLGPYSIKEDKLFVFKIQDINIFCNTTH